MTDLAEAVAATATGLTAGVYLAFSTMVMPALARTPPNSALAMMQRINDLAVRPVFMIVFFGAAVGSALVLFTAWWPGGNRDAGATIAAVLSLASFVTTVAVNVPRNRRIAGLNPDSAADRGTWLALSRQWSRGNHVRAVCAGLALVAYLGWH